MVAHKPDAQCLESLYEQDLLRITLCGEQHCAATGVLPHRSIFSFLLVHFVKFLTMLRKSDYLTANGPDITTPLNESQKEELYSELASGAETGWDYTVRFASQPTAGGTNDTNPVLRSLNIKGTVPICLNSILCELLSNAYGVQYY